MDKTLIYTPSNCQPPRSASSHLRLDARPWRLNLAPGTNKISAESLLKLQSNTSFQKYFDWGALTVQEDQATPADDPAHPQALALINNASAASEIEVLPKIGEVSAGLIFDARPTAGYASLTEVSAVEGLPSSINWTTVEQWTNP